MDRASAEAIGQFIADHPGRMRTMAWPGLILARSPIVGDIIESVLNIRRRKPEGGKEGVGKSVCLHYHSRLGGNEVTTSRGLGGKGDDTAAVTGLARRICLWERAALPRIGSHTIVTEHATA